ncbi:hypothetical protein GW17_00021160 [Ensete ventricosum]|nr:hypothetical protein GW17_00021160 [Ensete ventricosum]
MPLGSSPCGLAALCLQAFVAAGGCHAAGRRSCSRHAAGRCSCGRRAVGDCRAVGGFPCRWLPLQGALAIVDRSLAGGQAVVDRLSMGPGRGWPPSFLVAFVVKMQQERVEQFYAMQSHHTEGREVNRWGRPKL